MFACPLVGFASKLRIDTSDTISLNLCQRRRRSLGVLFLRALVWGNTLLLLTLPDSADHGLTSEVLIHDLKMRLEIWSPVWELLREDGHRLIAMDLPGPGQSPK